MAREVSELFDANEWAAGAASGTRATRLTHRTNHPTPPGRHAR